MRCSGVFASSFLKEYVIVGELALDGRVRPVNGILSMAITAAANGFKQMIVPIDNAKEAAVVQELEVYGAGSLTQAASFLSGRLALETTVVNIDELFDVGAGFDAAFGDEVLFAVDHVGESCGGVEVDLHCCEVAIVYA